MNGHYYEFEFPNIKELTLLIDDQTSILPVHMFPNLQKLTIIAKHGNCICTSIMTSYIPHIKSILPLRDLYITNIYKNDTTCYDITIEQLIRKKIPKINITFTNDLNLKGDIHKLMKHLSLIT